MSGIIGFLAIITGVCFTACDNPSQHTPDSTNTLSGTVRISGYAQIGQILTADTSELDGGSGAITYQWRRGGNNIGSNSSTYTVLIADVGSTITVTVTRADISGSVASSPTDIVAGASTGTMGLAYTLINNDTAYSVSKGTSNATMVVIPFRYNGLPVLEIADSGFASYTNMTNIIISEAIIKVGDFAFFECSSLTTVFFIGLDSSAWSEIVIGSFNTLLTNATRYYYSEEHPGFTTSHWRYVDGIPSVWMTTGLAFTLINNGTAYSVSRGTANDAVVVIPATHNGLPVTEIIGFAEYTNMTGITIPNSVNSIGRNAFRGCTSLSSIIIPDGVTFISSDAFSGCTILAIIQVSANNPGYSSQEGILYNKAKTEIVYVPLSISGSITMPNSVTSIGNNAFAGREGLTSITISDSVTSIGGTAFSGCTALTDIQVSANNPRYSSQEGILYNRAKTEIVYVPLSISGSITVPNSVTSIGNSAFAARERLTSITISDNVISIGSTAFYDCIGLTSIIIPNKVTSIGIDAFNGCINLSSVIIPASMTSIGDSAFWICTALSMVFYGGATDEAWRNISISSGNDNLTTADRYYYSATEPSSGTPNTYWRWVDRIPSVW